MIVDRNSFRLSRTAASGAGVSLTPCSSHRAHRVVARALAAMLLFGVAVSAWGEERFHQSFRGEQSGEPMIALSSADAAKYAKRTREGYLFALPAADAPISAAGLMAQFHVRGDFKITAGYEIVEVTPPTTGYGSGASLFVVTGSAHGATVARSDRPEAGPTITTDRIAAMGTGRDKHEPQSVAALGTVGRLQLIREGTTLRYLAAEGDAEPQEVRRERFVGDDLTTVLLLADTGLSTGALTVRFTDFSVSAAALPLGSISENQARNWIFAWLAASILLVSSIATGVALIRKKRPADTAA